MPTPVTAINHHPLWHQLQAAARSIQDQHMLEWFDSDPQRASRLTHTAAGIVADFSKQRIDQEILRQLLELARSTGLEQGIDAMFGGAPINSTENRAVLHVALRGSVDAELSIDGQNVSTTVATELERMLHMAQSIRSGDWRGVTGQKITDVVNIGIGGSDLGPRLVTTALTPLHDNLLNVHFVSNVDAHELLETLSGLQPETTLFIIASKSFGTEETLVNATIARTWLLQSGHAGILKKHMIAVSTNLKRVAEFGMDPDTALAFWDWVGGRFSVWSVIGMPIALAAGTQNFREFLRGAALMDAHFRTAPWAQNLPVLMALVAIWNRNFMGHGSQAVVPYYHFLKLLPQYLQQAEMESNGKGVMRDGTPLEVVAAPVVWGTAGTDAQHAYFQMLHQGPEPVPVDFVLGKRCLHSEPDSHRRLLTHAIAQSEALLCGRIEKDSHSPLAAHQYCPGNRPSTTLLLEQIDACHLGALLALYEHKIFVQGHIFGINSFDQFGVELGKHLATQIRPMMTGEATLDGHDASTLNLLRLCRI